MGIHDLSVKSAKFHRVIRTVFVIYPPPPNTYLDMNQRSTNFSCTINSLITSRHYFYFCYIKNILNYYLWQSFNLKFKIDWAHTPKQPPANILCLPVPTPARVKRQSFLKGALNFLQGDPRDSIGDLTEKKLRKTKFFQWSERKK